MQNWDPGQSRVFDFACVREGGNTLASFAAPEFELRFDVLTPDARLAMPHRSLRAKAFLAEPASGWPTAGTNGCFVFDGKDDCLEIDRDVLVLPEGPFTVEAWVKPADEQDGSIVSNLKIGGFSLDVAGAPRFCVQTDPASVNERTHARLKPAVIAKASQALKVGQWHHLAGVYNGAEITLFVNGKKAASARVTGARLGSDKCLYVGARPNTAWNVYNHSYPTAFWKGAVDEVRITRGARYSQNFTPGKQLARDGSTVLALANDQSFGPYVPVASAGPFQATINGNARLLLEER